MTSFERDGVALVECRSLAGAFAALLEAKSPDAQALPQGERWGRAQVPATAPPVGVLILSRDRWNRLDRFLDAIERHFPGTPVWVGAESLLIEVRGQGRPGEAAPAPEASPSTGGLLGQARPMRMPPPALRLTPPDEPRGTVPASPRESQPAESQTPEPQPDPARSPPPAREPEARRGSEAAVTKDEIEMLLRLFDDLHDGDAAQGPNDRPDGGPNRPRPNGGDA